MLQQIRSFLVVAEAGSLRRAADRLRMSQSALSRQMQALEHELGGSLLDRTSTGVGLTRSGYALAERMGAVLKGFDLVVSEVRRLMRGEGLQLRVGYLGSAAREYLEGPRRHVKRRHPDLALKLLDLSPGEQIAALRAGKIDVGITDHSGEVLAREFYVRQLAKMGSYIGLPDHHPLAGLTHVHLAKLKDETFVTGNDKHLPGVHRRMVTYCRKFGRFRAKFAPPVGTLAEVFESIVNESSVAILPGYMSHYTVPGIALVPLADRGITWELLVVWQRGKIGGALQTLIEALFHGKKAKPLS
jgi:DNA-binding transcriptional LysR family regulator